MRQKTNGEREEVQTTKERILQEAVKVFSRYGYHGTTTRMIAKEAGINISALHYHWGDKQDLYKAAVICVNKMIAKSHKLIGEKMNGSSTHEEKIDHSVEIMSDLLFSHPECASLSVFDTFLDTRSEGLGEGVDESTLRNYRTIIREFYGTDEISGQQMFELIATIQTMHHLVMSKSYFMEVLNVDEETFRDMVKTMMKKMYNITLPAQ